MKYRKNTIFFQKTNQLCPLLQVLSLNIKHMAIMDTAFRDNWQFYFTRFLQRLQVSIIPPPPGQTHLVNFVRHLQLGIQISRIHIAGKIGWSEINPTVFVHLAAEKLTPVRSFLPVNLGLLHMPFIPDQQCAALPHTIILRLMKAETSEIPYRSQGFPFIRSHNALGGIFHHHQPITPGNVHDLIHLTGNPGIMHHRNRLSLFRNRRLYQILINIHRILPDIHKYRHSSPKYKSIRRGYESIRRHDYLIPLLNIRQKRRHLQSMGTGSSQQALRRSCPLLYPPAALPRKLPVPAYLLILHCPAHIFHFFPRKRRHIKINHHSSPFLRAFML